MELRLRLQKLSLTQRLTALFTVIAAIVVLGLGLLFLAETRHHFDELDRMTLANKRLLVSEILGSATSENDARSRLAQAVNAHHGLLVEVQDTSGAIVFQSEGFIPGLTSAFTTPPDPASGFGRWQGSDGLFHTLVFDRVPAYSPAGVRVLLAAGVEHHTDFLSDLQHKLLLYVAAAIALCALLSWLIVRKGLAPLRRMKSRAAVVTGQKLTERMPVAAVPIEMADLARELNEMLDRLQEAFQRLTDYSSDLAHELRTPISNLLMQTQVALAVKRDAAAYRDILESNAEEYQRLARMVSDMLFLAKTERGANLPNNENFSAHDEIAELIDFYGATAEEKGIVIGLTGDSRMRGDRLMFRRALSNLLSNALRHAPRAGDIRITVAQAATASEITVENSGPDIDPEALPRLFDRFYRSDPARSHADAEGTGLGLAITRAIVEVHGGSVRATSAEGRTRFSLSFPHLDGRIQGGQASRGPS